MFKQALKTWLFILSVFLFVAAILYQPYLFTLVIGGVITQGILGGYSGKVGPTVGANWKGIDYVRSYVVPQDPNTVAQQGQRTKFQIAILLARQILSNIINVYWDPFASGMSGFNKVTREFLNTLDVSNKLVAITKVTKGTLQNLGVVTATYSTVSGTASVSWTVTGAVGNGLETDSVKMVCYDKSTNTFYVPAISAQRTDGFADGTIPTGLTATNLIFYAFAVQGSGSSLLVSDSVGDVAAAP